MSVGRMVVGDGVTGAGVGAGVGSRVVGAGVGAEVGKALGSTTVQQAPEQK